MQQPSQHLTGRLLLAAHDAGKPVSALCHGVVAFLSARTDGAWLYRGRRMTGFTDEEEVQGGYGDDNPFSVEARLREAGGILQTGAPWSDTVVIDGGLITGKNPQSTSSTALALVSALRDQPAA
jgi:putative intracellular protease/amidase